MIEKDNELSFESNALGEKLTHKLIIGENYDALKNLLAVYENKVDFIYIDPPYNTESTRTDGNSLTDIEGQNTGKFIYRDKFSRTGWLNMMNERLQLARKLLSDKGVIFISIDDNEQAYLKVLCDDVFGEENFVGTMIRKTASNRAMAKYFNCLHEYCLLYCKNIKYLDIKGELKDVTNYTNPDNDPNGAWTSGNPSMSGSSNNFGVENPYTHKIDYPPKGRGWVFNQEKMKKLIKSGQLVFKKKYKENERGFFLKQYLEGKSEYQLVNSMFFARNEFLNQVATKQDMTMFDDIVFSNPKPVCFIKNLIKFSTQPDSIILDFFAGSGTTGQAVMELNEEDGGKRQFILCTNNENGIAENITYERLYRVINGEGTKGEQIKWQYSKDKKSLKNNNLDVFRIGYHQLGIEDYEKGEQLIEQAKEVFKQLDNNFELKGEFDIYNKLASLKPYSEKDRAECEKGFSYQNKQTEEVEDKENEEEQD